MKKLTLALLIALSANVALADGAGIGTEEVIAAGGLTTVVGGCADAQVTINGENSEIVYTGPCNSAPTVTHGSDFTSVYPTPQLAAANCHPGQGFVQAKYNWKFKLLGYQCAPLTDSQGN